MTESTLIELKNIIKSFNGHRVLDGVNLSIKKGKITAIIGKSGTGKSVLLKHIIGLLQPDEGQILFMGKPLSTMSTSEERSLKHHLSYMFQDNALFDFMTVWQNIALPLSENKVLPKAQIKERVETRMSQLGLEGIGEQYPAQLSGGMKKRVALARALVTDPDIVLFDEPTTGLDPVRKKNVHRMIHEYQEQFGFTAVIVTHDIPTIFDIVQHIALLDSGRIIFEGTKADIDSTRNETVQAFIHGNDLKKE